jgi:hypothetical protein
MTVYEITVDKIIVYSEKTSYKMPTYEINIEKMNV